MCIRAYPLDFTPFPLPRALVILVDCFVDDYVQEGTRSDSKRVTMVRFANDRRARRFPIAIHPKEQLHLWEVLVLVVARRSHTHTHTSQGLTVSGDALTPFGFFLSCLTLSSSRSCRRWRTPVGASVRSGLLARYIVFRVSGVVGMRVLRCLPTVFVSLFFACDRRSRHESAGHWCAERQVGDAESALKDQQGRHPSLSAAAARPTPTLSSAICSRPRSNSRSVSCSARSRFVLDGTCGARQCADDVM